MSTNKLSIISAAQQQDNMFVELVGMLQGEGNDEAYEAEQFMELASMPQRIWMHVSKNKYLN